MSPSNTQGNSKIRWSSHRFIDYLLKYLFQLLYNQFAWTYDWVADIVSLGKWQKWVRSVVPYLESSPILELGHGPGHLLGNLNRSGKSIFGLDSSSRMVRIAAQRFKKDGLEPCLVLGKAQNLPYSDRAFRRVVATFPSDLQEVWRVLDDSGELIVLMAAWMTGEMWYEKLIAWLFRVTGQAPDSTQLGKADRDLFQLTHASEVGFQVNSNSIDLDSSQVLIIQAKKVIPEYR
jgi:ubiquinone/menaquinone biosynthesis C-methylase UbiE